MKRIAFTATSLFLAACASQPQEIASTYVPTAAYQDYTCEQISMDLQRVERRIGELEETLKETANKDVAQMAVGVVMLWPVLFFLEGGDGPQAEEYARFKGERNALEKVAVEKTCVVNSVRQPDANETSADAPTETPAEAQTTGG